MTKDQVRSTEEALKLAQQVPLVEQLESVPADARLVIDDADGMCTRYIPVGRMCHDAAKALAAPYVASPRVQEPVAYVVTTEVHGQMCSFIHRIDLTKLLPDGAKLYTTPPAAPVQEPVAWMFPDDLERFETSETFAQAYSIEMGSPTQGVTVPLYTTPPAAQRQSARSAWVGLTDEEAEKLAEQVGMFVDKYGLARDAENGLEDGVDIFGFARSIEAKLKEKNSD